MAGGGCVHSKYAKLKSIPEAYMIRNRSSRPYRYMLRLEAFDAPLSV